MQQRIRQGPAQVQSVLLNMQKRLDEQRLMGALKVCPGTRLPGRGFRSWLSLRHLPTLCLLQSQQDANKRRGYIGKVSLEQTVEHTPHPRRCGHLAGVRLDLRLKFSNVIVSKLTAAS